MNVAPSKLRNRLVLPSYHVQDFVHDIRFPYALYWDFCKKLGKLLVLRKSIKILSKRSEIDYLKNEPAYFCC